MINENEEKMRKMERIEGAKVGDWLFSISVF